MQELKLIREWAQARQITCQENGSNLQAQFVKLIEEAGELAHGIARNHPEEITDAIGDMVVVLTIMAALHGVSIERCIKAAYFEIQDRKGTMQNGVFIKE